MIKLIAIGHLGKDATTNTVNSKTVINFSVCHTEKYKDAQGVQQSKSVWIECSQWTDKAGIVPYLKKGIQVYVEGQPEAQSYQTNDGRTGVKLALRVSSVQLLGTKEDSGGQSNVPNPTSPTYQPTAAAAAQQASVPSDDDSLPF